MPSRYIILNLSLCCDIYLFCLVLEPACLLSRTFYLQILFLLFVCAWVLLPARLWLCFNAYFIACFCFDCLLMYVFVLCIMYYVLHVLVG
jgi:hypothetical protein